MAEDTKEETDFNPSGSDSFYSDLSNSGKEYGTCFVRYAFPVGRSSRIPVDNLEFNSSVNYHHQRTNKVEAHECDLDLLIKELAKKIDEIEFPLSE
ncbi:18866_t:CDS:2 [Entrophospora sp. SA101]|nr:15740_t:CDS:2 [Entrophospora sp. SA101]CAJ0747812.1 8250_t:CDS:2 [Entrophospora sp. SA101]CAJ0755477.1 18866_t:CDS:2 [Entrophospora sp. SA101]CAJ0850453.1 10760_t:CDS:2 [Entrophospora sp. SA101]CAJ0906662.1 9345_t:CDS:2 [Entrophospora sp. SA101]